MLNESEIKLDIQAKKLAYWAERELPTPPEKMTMLACQGCKRTDVTLTRVYGELRHVGCQKRVL